MNFKKRLISILVVSFLISSNFLQLSATEVSETLDIIELFSNKKKKTDIKNVSKNNITIDNIKIEDNKILVENLEKLGTIIYQISDDEKNNTKKINSIKITFSHNISTVAYKKDNKYVLGLSEDQTFKQRVKYLPNKTKNILIHEDEKWYQCKFDEEEEVYIFEKIKKYKDLKALNSYQNDLIDYGVNIFVSEDGQEYKRLETDIKVECEEANPNEGEEILTGSNIYIETLTVGNGIGEDVKYIKIELNEASIIKNQESSEIESGETQKPVGMMKVLNIEFEISKNEQEGKESGENRENKEDENSVRNSKKIEEEKLKLQTKTNKHADPIKLGSSALNKVNSLDEAKEKKYKNAIWLLEKQLKETRAERDKYKKDKTIDRKYLDKYERDLKKYKKDMAEYQNKYKDINKYFGQCVNSDKTSKDLSSRYADIDRYKKANQYSNKNKINKYIDDDNYNDYDDYDDYDDYENKITNKTKVKSKKSNLKNKTEDDITSDVEYNYKNKDLKKSQYKNIDLDDEEYIDDNYLEKLEDNNIEDVLADDQDIEDLENLANTNLDKNQSTQVWSENLDRDIESVEEKQVKAEKTVGKVYLSGLVMTLTSVLAYDKIGLLKKLIKI